MTKKKEKILEDKLRCSDLCSTPLGTYRIGINIQLGLLYHVKMCLIESECISKEYVHGINYCLAYQLKTTY